MQGTTRKSCVNGLQGALAQLREPTSKTHHPRKHVARSVKQTCPHEAASAQQQTSGSDFLTSLRLPMQGLQQPNAGSKAGGSRAAVHDGKCFCRGILQHSRQRCSRDIMPLADVEALGTPGLRRQRLRLGPRPLAAREVLAAPEIASIGPVGLH